MSMGLPREGKDRARAGCSGRHGSQGSGMRQAKQQLWGAGLQAVQRSKDDTAAWVHSVSGGTWP